MPSSPKASSSKLSEDGEVSDSELFDELERELDEDDHEGGGFDMGEYRERRMQQLKEEWVPRPLTSG